MARACDILMIAAPGGPDTRNIVNAEILEALGPDGILINIARGTLVDEPALIAALQSRTILSAGLDVFAEEPKVPPAFFELDNVVMLPHVGSGSHATRRAMYDLVIANLIAWKDKRDVPTPIAETPWPRPRKNA